MNRSGRLRYVWLGVITLVMAIALPSRVDLQVWMLRLTNSCPGCSLGYVKLSNLDLAGANLRGADLHGAVLTNVDLSHADLREANLRDATFNGVRIKGTKLCNATLLNALNPTLVMGQHQCD